MRTLMDVWHDSLHQFDGGAPDGEPPPPVPVLALLILRTGLDMMPWAFPEGAIAKAANNVRDLPDELARLIARAMSNSL